MGLQTRVGRGRSRRNDFKMEVQNRYWTETLYCRAVKHWNRWPGEIVNAAVLEVFKAGLDGGWHS